LPWWRDDVLVWLGELITEWGIGNGISIIIFAGIVAGLPQQIQQGFLASSQFLGLAVNRHCPGNDNLHRYFHGSTSADTRAIRTDHFQSGRMYRNRVHLHPLRVNTAGMIPLILQFRLLSSRACGQLFAAPTGATPNFWNTIRTGLTPVPRYPWAFSTGAVFCTGNRLLFFYTMVIFEQQNLPATFQRQGGFIPGIRPGKPTSEYLNFVIYRITTAGRCFWVSWQLSLPRREVTNVQVFTVVQHRLVIVVGVILDTMKQMEAQLAMRRLRRFHQVKFRPMSFPMTGFLKQELECI